MPRTPAAKITAARPVPSLDDLMADLPVERRSPAIHHAATPVASRLTRKCEESEIPHSTMRSEIRRGRGPKVFLIGRLLFVTETAWADWMRRMEQEYPASPHGRARDFGREMAA